MTSDVSIKGTMACALIELQRHTKNEYVASNNPFYKRTCFYFVRKFDLFYRIPVFSVPPPVTFGTNRHNFMKLGMNIIPLDVILFQYFLISCHQ
jgi:hypothetical protein